MYEVIFSRRAERAFLDLPDRYARQVREAVEKLRANPRPRGTVKLQDAPVAQYRYRVGDHRILFDIDDENQVIELLDIRRRSERTYQ